MADALRWGIVSTGRIARTFAEHLETTRSGRLVAVASRDADRARAFAKDFMPPDSQEVRAHSSYDDLLADDDIDAVYIATPHPQHARWAIAAAEAGKHILCEKPIAMNLAEAQAVLDAAERAGVFCMEAFMYRCHPQTALLAEQIRDGAIGEVRVIEATHSFKGPDDPSGRLLSSELGGGGILDVGCYCVSGARFVAACALGTDAVEPSAVMGAGHIGDTGVDEWAVGTLRFDGDIVANLSTGVRVDQPPRLRIHGSSGSIVLREPWLPGVRGKAEIVVYRHDAEPQILKPKVDRGLYAYEADVVADAVATGRTQAGHPAPTWDDTLANMRTLDRWRSAVGVSYESDELPAPVHGRALSIGSAQRQSIGSERIEVSPVALGTMLAQGRDTLASALATFDAYAEAGGNTFDTAYIYADGASESALGHWHTSRGVRDDIVIITKGAHTPDTFPERVRPQLERSLERLRTDHADIYFLHRDNPDIAVAEFVDALESLRREGLIRSYGGSNWTTARIDEANGWAQANGAAGFTVVSNQFSLARMDAPTFPGTIGANDPSSRAWLASTQITNFAWSSQAAGFFAGLQPDGFLAHAWFSNDNLERRRRTEQLAAELGVQPVTVALAWVLHVDLPVIPIVGPVSIAELRTSMRALDVPLSEQQVRWLDLADDR